MPKGGFFRLVCTTLAKLTKMPWAVSGSQVVQAGLVLDRAQIGLQHHVEVARLRPLAPGAAVRAGDLLQAAGGPTLPMLVLLLEVVGPESLVAGQALGQRIAEHPDVAGGHPDRAGQDDRGVEADDVVTPRDHRAPPLLLDVLLQLDPERAVVPRRPRPAVDLTRGEDEPAPLAQADHLFETVGVGSAGRGHVDSPQDARDRPRVGRSQRTRLSLAQRPDLNIMGRPDGDQTAWAASNDLGFCLTPLVAGRNPLLG